MTTIYDMVEMQEEIDRQGVVIDGLLHAIKDLLDKFNTNYSVNYSDFLALQAIYNEAVLARTGMSNEEKC
jgi:hypothetical protein